MTAIVSEKGEVVIPKEIRDQLGILPGTVLDFAAESGALVGKKETKVDPRRKWRGAGREFIGKFGGVDAYLQMTRGRRNDDGD